MNNERLDEIVDGLLNIRSELTSYVSESLLQAELYDECRTDAIELMEQNKRYREAIEFAIKYLKNSDMRQIQLVVSALGQALEESECS